jgi:hypothetical protein
MATSICTVAIPTARPDPAQDGRVFHVHVQLGCIAPGLLQHLAINPADAVWRCLRSWLRPMNPTLLAIRK